MKLPKTTGVILGLFLAIGLTGCTNVSCLQTARVLEKDKGRFFAGGGYAAIPEYSDTTSPGLKRFPYLELGGRVGVAPKLDVGAKLTVIGSISFDGKYQLVDAGNFALAAGFGLGGMPKDNDSTASKNKNDILELLLPLYASYDASEYFSVYSSPKYVYRKFVGGEIRESENMLGATVGAKIGKSAGVYIESTLLRILGTNLQTFQMNASLFWNLGSSDEKQKTTEKSAE